MEKTNMIKEIELPQGIEAKFDNYELSMKGPKGEIKKRLASKQISIIIEKDKIKAESKTTNKKEKKILHTFVAHIKNMIKGAEEGFVYKLKICSGHFPMNVTIKGDSFSVKNLFGEKIPRVVKIRDGSTVKVEGDIITVESINKETAGQMAADIEQLTRRTGFDRRIFQDGIYITEKAGKELK